MTSRDNTDASDTVACDVDNLARGKKRERTHELLIEDAIFENFGEYDFQRQKRFSVAVHTLLRDLITDDNYLPLPSQFENVYLRSKRDQVRIVDLCAIIGDTLFMVECDENGHRHYDQEDENKRVCDIWEGCDRRSMVIVRIDPTLRDVSMQSKQSMLISEVRIQIDKIKNETTERDRTFYTEIKLFYPGSDVRVERLVKLPSDLVNKHLTLNEVPSEKVVNEPEMETAVIDRDHLEWFRSMFCYLANQGKYYDYETRKTYTKLQFIAFCADKQTAVQCVDKWTRKVVTKKYDSASLWIKDRSQVQTYYDLTNVPGGHRVIPHPSGPKHLNLLNVWVDPSRESSMMRTDRVSLQIKNFDAAQAYAFQMIDEDAIPLLPKGLDEIFQDFKDKMRGTKKDIRGVTSFFLCKRLKECFGDALQKNKGRGRNVWVFKSHGECARAFAKFMNCDVSNVF